MIMHLKKNQLGFTLIEMIVSLGVFSVVVTTAVGAMLMLIANNQRLQAEQSVMTNLAFALDTMTREIRTGYNYYCTQELNGSGNTNIFADGNNHEAIISASVDGETKNCPVGRSQNYQLQGVSFFEAGNSITGADTRILYFYDATAKTIMRKVGRNTSQSIVSSGLTIENAVFYVTGTEPKSENSVTPNPEQPTVTIYIEAKENPATATSKVYSLQTTVTQRSLDL